MSGNTATSVNVATGSFTIANARHVLTKSLFAHSPNHASTVSAATIHGQFHGAGAQGVSGVWQVNNQAPGSGGGFIGHVTSRLNHTLRVSLDAASTSGVATGDIESSSSHGTVLTGNWVGYVGTDVAGYVTAANAGNSEIVRAVLANHVAGDPGVNRFPDSGARLNGVTNTDGTRSALVGATGTRYDSAGFEIASHNAAVYTYTVPGDETKQFITAVAKDVPDVSGFEGTYSYRGVYLAGNGNILGVTTKSHRVTTPFTLKADFSTRTFSISGRASSGHADLTGTGTISALTGELSSSSLRISGSAANRVATNGSLYGRFGGAGAQGVAGVYLGKADTTSAGQLAGAFVGEFEKDIAFVQLGRTFASNGAVARATYRSVAGVGVAALHATFTLITPQVADVDDNHELVEIVTKHNAGALAAIESGITFTSATANITIDGAATPARIYLDRSGDAQLYLLATPSGSDAIVARGNPLTGTPTGTHVFFGLHTDALLANIGRASEGAFTLRVDFGTYSFRDYVGISYDGVLETARLTARGGTIDPVSGRFRSVDADYTVKAGTAVDATLYGQFHGEGASALAGVWHTNEATPLRAGAFLGGRAISAGPFNRIVAGFDDGGGITSRVTVGGRNIQYLGTAAAVHARAVNQENLTDPNAGQNLISKFFNRDADLGQQTALPSTRWARAGSSNVTIDGTSLTATSLWSHRYEADSRAFLLELPGREHAVILNARDRAPTFVDGMRFHGGIASLDNNASAGAARALGDVSFTVNSDGAGGFVVRNFNSFLNTSSIPSNNATVTIGGDVRIDSASGTLSTRSGRHTLAGVTTPVAFEGYFAASPNLGSTTNYSRGYGSFVALWHTIEDTPGLIGAIVADSTRLSRAGPYSLKQNFPQGVAGIVYYDGRRSRDTDIQANGLSGTYFGDRAYHRAAQANRVDGLTLDTSYIEVARRYHPDTALRDRFATFAPGTPTAVTTRSPNVTGQSVKIQNLVSADYADRTSHYFVETRNNAKLAFLDAEGFDFTYVEGRTRTRIEATGFYVYSGYLLAAGLGNVAAAAGNPDSSGTFELTARFTTQAANVTGFSGGIGHARLTSGAGSIALATGRFRIENASYRTAAAATAQGATIDGQIFGADSRSVGGVWHTQQNTPTWVGGFVGNTDSFHRVADRSGPVAGDPVREVFKENRDFQVVTGQHRLPGVSTWLGVAGEGLEDFATQANVGNSDFANAFAGILPSTFTTTKAAVRGILASTGTLAVGDDTLSVNAYEIASGNAALYGIDSGNNRYLVATAKQLSGTPEGVYVYGGSYFYSDTRGLAPVARTPERLGFVLTATFNATASRFAFVGGRDGNIDRLVANGDVDAYTGTFESFSEGRTGGLQFSANGRDDEYGYVWGRFGGTDYQGVSGLFYANIDAVAGGTDAPRDYAGGFVGELIGKQTFTREANVFADDDGEALYGAGGVGRGLVLDVRGSEAVRKTTSYIVNDINKAIEGVNKGTNTRLLTFVELDVAGSVQLTADASSSTSTSVRHTGNLNLDSGASYKTVVWSDKSIVGQARLVISQRGTASGTAELPYLIATTGARLGANARGIYAYRGVFVRGPRSGALASSVSGDDNVGSFTLSANFISASSANVASFQGRVSGATLSAGTSTIDLTTGRFGITNARWGASTASLFGQFHGDAAEAVSGVWHVNEEDSDDATQGYAPQTIGGFVGNRIGSDTFALGKRQGAQGVGSGNFEQAHGSGWVGFSGNVDTFLSNANTNDSSRLNTLLGYGDATFADDGARLNSVSEHSIGASRADVIQGPVYTQTTGFEISTHNAAVYVYHGTQDNYIAATATPVSDRAGLSGTYIYGGIYVTGDGGAGSTGGIADATDPQRRTRVPFTLQASFGDNSFIISGRATSGGQDLSGIGTISSTTGTFSSNAVRISDGRANKVDTSGHISGSFGGAGAQGVAGVFFGAAGNTPADLITGGFVGRLESRISVTLLGDAFKDEGGVGIGSFSVIDDSGTTTSAVPVTILSPDIGDATAGGNNAATNAIVAAAAFEEVHWNALSQASPEASAHSRAGQTAVGGSLAAVRVWTDRNTDADARLLIFDPQTGADTAVARGAAFGRGANGVYTYGGVHVSGARTSLADADVGTFTIVANFASPTQATVTSYIGAAEGNRLVSASGSIAAGTGRFSITNATYTARGAVAGAGIAASLHGQFHGATAQAVTGVWHANTSADATVAAAGAFIGNRFSPRGDYSLFSTLADGAGAGRGGPTIGGARSNLVFLGPSIRATVDALNSGTAGQVIAVLAGHNAANLIATTTQLRTANYRTGTIQVQGASVAANASIPARVWRDNSGNANLYLLATASGDDLAVATSTAYTAPAAGTYLYDGIFASGGLSNVGAAQVGDFTVSATFTASRVSLSNFRGVAGIDRLEAASGAVTIASGRFSLSTARLTRAGYAGRTAASIHGRLGGTGGRAISGVWHTNDAVNRSASQGAAGGFVGNRITQALFTRHTYLAGGVGGALVDAGLATGTVLDPAHGGGTSTWIGYVGIDVDDFVYDARVRTSNLLDTVTRFTDEAASRTDGVARHRFITSDSYTLPNFIVHEFRITTHNAAAYVFEENNAGFNKPFTVAVARDVPGISSLTGKYVYSGTYFETATVSTSRTTSPFVLTANFDTDRFEIEGRNTLGTGGDFSGSGVIQQVNGQFSSSTIRVASGANADNSGRVYGKFGGVGAQGVAGVFYGNANSSSASGQLSGAFVGELASVSTLDRLGAAFADNGGVAGGNITSFNSEGERTEPLALIFIAPEVDGFVTDILRTQAQFGPGFFVNPRTSAVLTLAHYDDEAFDAMRLVERSSVRTARHYTGGHADITPGTAHTFDSRSGSYWRAVSGGFRVWRDRGERGDARLIIVNATLNSASADDLLVVTGDPYGGNAHGTFTYRGVFVDGPRKTLIDATAGSFTLTARFASAAAASVTSFVGTTEGSTLTAAGGTVSLPTGRFAITNASYTVASTATPLAASLYGQFHGDAGEAVSGAWHTNESATLRAGAFIGNRTTPEGPYKILVAPISGNVKIHEYDNIRYVKWTFGVGGGSPTIAGNTQQVLYTIDDPHNETDRANVGADESSIATLAGFDVSSLQARDTRTGDAVFRSGEVYFGTTAAQVNLWLDPSNNARMFLVARRGFNDVALVSGNPLSGLPATGKYRYAGVHASGATPGIGQANIGNFYLEIDIAASGATISRYDGHAAGTSLSYLRTGTSSATSGVISSATGRFTVTDAQFKATSGSYALPSAIFGQLHGSGARAVSGIWRVSTPTTLAHDGVLGTLNSRNSFVSGAFVGSRSQSSNVSLIGRFADSSSAGVAAGTIDVSSGGGASSSVWIGYITGSIDSAISQADQGVSAHVNISAGFGPTEFGDDVARLEGVGKSSAVSISIRGRAGNVTAYETATHNAAYFSYKIPGSGTIESGGSTGVVVVKPLSDAAALGGHYLYRGRAMLGGIASVTESDSLDFELAADFDSSSFTLNGFGVVGSDITASGSIAKSTGAFSASGVSITHNSSTTTGGNLSGRFGGRGAQGVGGVFLAGNTQGAFVGELAFITDISRQGALYCVTDGCTQSGAKNERNAGVAAGEISAYDALGFANTISIAFLSNSVESEIGKVVRNVTGHISDLVASGSADFVGLASDTPTPTAIYRSGARFKLWLDNNTDAGARLIATGVGEGRSGAFLVAGTTYGGGGSGTYTYRGVHLAAYGYAARQSASSGSFTLGVNFKTANTATITSYRGTAGGRTLEVDNTDITLGDGKFTISDAKLTGASSGDAKLTATIYGQFHGTTAQAISGIWHSAASAGTKPLVAAEGAFLGNRTSPPAHTVRAKLDVVATSGLATGNHAVIQGGDGLVGRWSGLVTTWIGYIGPNVDAYVNAANANVSDVIDTVVGYNAGSFADTGSRVAGVGEQTGALTKVGSDAYGSTAFEIATHNAAIYVYDGIVDDFVVVAARDIPDIAALSGTYIYKGVHLTGTGNIRGVATRALRTRTGFGLVANFDSNRFTINGAADNGNVDLSGSGTINDATGEITSSSLRISGSEAGTVDESGALYGRFAGAGAQGVAGIYLGKANATESGQITGAFVGQQNSQLALSRIGSAFAGTDAGVAQGLLTRIDDTGQRAREVGVLLIAADIDNTILRAGQGASGALTSIFDVSDARVDALAQGIPTSTTTLRTGDIAIDGANVPVRIWRAGATRTKARLVTTNPQAGGDLVLVEGLRYGGGASGQHTYRGVHLDGTRSGIGEASVGTFTMRVNFTSANAATLQSYSGVTDRGTLSATNSSIQLASGRFQLTGATYTPTSGAAGTASVFAQFHADAAQGVSGVWSLNLAGADRAGAFLGDRKTPVGDVVAFEVPFGSGAGIGGGVVNVAGTQRSVLFIAPDLIGDLAAINGGGAVSPLSELFHFERDRYSEPRDDADVLTRATFDTWHGTYDDGQTAIGIEFAAVDKTGLASLVPFSTPGADGRSYILAQGARLTGTPIGEYRYTGLVYSSSWGDLRLAREDTAAASHRGRITLNTSFQASSAVVTQIRARTSGTLLRAGRAEISLQTGRFTNNDASFWQSAGVAPTGAATKARISGQFHGNAAQAVSGVWHTHPADGQANPAFGGALLANRTSRNRHTVLAYIKGEIEGQPTTQGIATGQIGTLLEVAAPGENWYGYVGANIDDYIDNADAFTSPELDLLTRIYLTAQSPFTPATGTDLQNRTDENTVKDTRTINGIDYEITQLSAANQEARILIFDDKNTTDSSNVFAMAYVNARNTALAGVDAVYRYEGTYITTGTNHLHGFTTKFDHDTSKGENRRRDFTLWADLRDATFSLDGLSVDAGSAGSVLADLTGNGTINLETGDIQSSGIRIANHGTSVGNRRAATTQGLLRGRIGGNFTSISKNGNPASALAGVFYGDVDDSSVRGQISGAFLGELAQTFNVTRAGDKLYQSGFATGSGIVDSINLRQPRGSQSRKVGFLVAGTDFDQTAGRRSRAPEIALFQGTPANAVDTPQQNGTVIVRRQQNDVDIDGRSGHIAIWSDALTPANTGANANVTLKHWNVGNEHILTITGTGQTNQQDAGGHNTHDTSTLPNRWQYTYHGKIVGGTAIELAAKSAQDFSVDVDFQAGTFSSFTAGSAANGNLFTASGTLNRTSGTFTSTTGTRAQRTVSLNGKFYGAYARALGGLWRSTDSGEAMVGAFIANRISTQATRRTGSGTTTIGTGAVAQTRTYVYAAYDRFRALTQPDIIAYLATMGINGTVVDGSTATTTKRRRTTDLHIATTGNITSVFADGFTVYTDRTPATKLNLYLASFNDQQERITIAVGAPVTPAQAPQGWYRFYGTWIAGTHDSASESELAMHVDFGTGPAAQRGQAPKIEYLRAGSLLAAEGVSATGSVNVQEGTFTARGTNGLSSAPVAIQGSFHGPQYTALAGLWTQGERVGALIANRDTALYNDASTARNMRLNAVEDSEGKGTHKVGLASGELFWAYRGDDGRQRNNNLPLMVAATNIKRTIDARTHITSLVGVDAGHYNSPRNGFLAAGANETATQLQYPIPNTGGATPRPSHAHGYSIGGIRGVVDVWQDRVTTGANAPHAQIRRFQQHAPNINGAQPAGVAAGGVTTHSENILMVQGALATNIPATGAYEYRGIMFARTEPGTLDSNLPTTFSVRFDFATSRFSGFQSVVDKTSRDTTTPTPRYSSAPLGTLHASGTLERATGVFRATAGHP